MLQQTVTKFGIGAWPCDHIAMLLSQMFTGKCMPDSYCARSICAFISSAMYQALPIPRSLLAQPLGATIQADWGRSDRERPAGAEKWDDMNTVINSDLIDPRGSVGRQLVQILRERIIENKMTPGERLSEAELSVQFGVSRQPVREAFIKLSEEGLVQVRPQRGTFVCKISLRAVEDARFIREAIEGDLVRILAVNPKAALLRDLRAQLDAQRHLCLVKTAPQERAEFLRLDDLFHRTLAEAAGRKHLWQNMDGVKSQMDRVRYLTTQSLDIERLVAQHTAVFDAIAAKDPVRAEAAMRLHLRTILQDLAVHQSRTPEIFDAADVDIQSMARVALTVPE